MGLLARHAGAGDLKSGRRRAVGDVVSMGRSVNNKASGGHDCSDSLFLQAREHAD